MTIQPLSSEMLPQQQPHNPHSQGQGISKALQTPCPTPVVGLTNLGNTCFFNSALQLLLACPPLMKELQPPPSPQQQQQAQVQAQSPSAVQAVQLGRGPLGFALQQAVLHMHGGSRLPRHPATYNPQALLAAVCRHAPQFKGRRQHDSHELMRLLLDGMHEEERRAREWATRQQRRASTSSPCSTAVAAAVAEAAGTLQPAAAAVPVAAAVAGTGGPRTRHQLQQMLQQQQQQQEQEQQAAAAGAEACPGCQSPHGGAAGWATPTSTARLFGGELASIIVCHVCGHESVTYEPFFDLSLPLPTPPSGEWFDTPSRPARAPRGKAKDKAQGKGKGKSKAEHQEGEAEAVQGAAHAAVHSSTQAEMAVQQGQPAEQQQGQGQGQGQAPEGPRRRGRLKRSLLAPDQAAAGAAGAAGQAPQAAVTKLGAKQQRQAAAEARRQAILSNRRQQKRKQQDRASSASSSSSSSESGEGSDSADGSSGGSKSGAGAGREGATSDAEQSSISTLQPPASQQQQQQAAGAMELDAPSQQQQRQQVPGSKPMPMRRPQRPTNSGPAGSPVGAASWTAGAGVLGPAGAAAVPGGVCSSLPRQQHLAHLHGSTAHVSDSTVAGVPRYTWTERPAGLPVAPAVAPEPHGGEAPGPGAGSGAPAAASDLPLHQHVMVTRSKARKISHGSLTGLLRGARAAAGGSCSSTTTATTTTTGLLQQQVQAQLNLQGESSVTGAAGAEAAAGDAGAGDMEIDSSPRRAAGPPGGCMSSEPSTATHLNPSQLSRLNHDMGAMAIAETQNGGTGVNPGSTEQGPAGPPTLRDCLGAFFQAESILWECSAEKARAQGGAGSAGGPHSGSTHSGLRKQVSWSARPLVHLVPASSEQRGTDLARAMRGLEPFTRPARLPAAAGAGATAAAGAAAGGAGPGKAKQQGAGPVACLVTAQLDFQNLDLLRVCLAAGTVDPRAAELLPKPLEVTVVDVSAAWRFPSELQAREVPDAVQAVLECTAQQVAGLSGTTHAECLEQLCGRLRGAVHVRYNEQEEEWHAHLAAPAYHHHRHHNHHTHHSQQTGTTHFEEQQHGQGQGQGQLQQQQVVPGHAASTRRGHACRQQQEQQQQQEENGMFDMDDCNPQAKPGGAADHENHENHGGHGGHGGRAAAAAASGVKSREQDGSSSGSGVEGGRDKQGNGAGGGSSTSSTSGSSSATSSCHVGGSTKGAPPPLLLPTSSARGILKPPGGIVSPTNRQPPAWSGFAASVPLDIKTPGRVTRSTALSSPQAEPQGCSPPSQPPQPPGFSLPSGVELPPGSSGFQRPASKLYRLHRVPPVLLLHLKRFQHNGRGRLSKICTAVQFDHQLDLAPYLPETSAVQPVTCLKYDLVGVVEHSGTMKSGHYVAYVKRAAGGGEGAMANGAADVAHAEQYSWHYVSDAAVRPATEEQVSKAQAYLLMYVRRGA